MHELDIGDLNYAGRRGSRLGKGMFLVYLDAVSCEKPQFVVWVIEDGRAVGEKLRTGNAVSVWFSLIVYVRVDSY